MTLRDVDSNIFASGLLEDVPVATCARLRVYNRTLWRPLQGLLQRSALQRANPRAGASLRGSRAGPSPHGPERKGRPLHSAATGRQKSQRQGQLSEQAAQSCVWKVSKHDMLKIVFSNK